MVSSLSLIAVFMAVVVVTLVPSTRASLALHCSHTDESMGVGCTNLEWATVLNVLGNATKDRRRERGLGQGQHQRQLTT
jgi:hypothetical protein